MELEQLQEEYRFCQICPILTQSRTQVVFGSGNKNAEILFIGEAPGANEDKQGIPFCGASGKVLDELLLSINLSRKDIFITNTILCRPPENRNPLAEEVENCRDRLEELIRIMKPKVIVTIGNYATNRIINKTGINSLRGKVFSINKEGREIKVVPVIHPANYLYSGRNPELLQRMKEDFKVISQIINENKLQKSLSEFSYTKDL